ncbi:transporter substrate-binding domain-containing protein [Gymnodinialimonas sp. 2305UL16-5]|uniref:ATP-binding protein n=1 Tax=Gymnodinialimonas mytili TaxID=3126503 RepID=UPI0030A4B616
MPLRRAIRLSGVCVIAAFIWLGTDAPKPGFAQYQTDEVVVAFTEFPPYSFAAEGGAGGYAIDILRAVAEREGLTLRFQQAENPAQAVAAAMAGEVDVISQLAPTAERSESLMFSNPIGFSNISVIVDPTRHDIRRVDQTAGLTLGYVRGSVATTVADIGPFDAVEIPTTDALIVAFLSGDIDGVLYVEQAFQRLAIRAGFEPRDRSLSPPLRSLELSIAMPSDGAQTERLLDAITSYRATPGYRQLQAQWLGPGPYWTSGRVLAAVSVAVLALLAVAVAFLAYRRRLKRRAEMAQIHMLENVARNLPFTFAMADQDGEVEFFSRAENDTTPYATADDLIAPSVLVGTGSQTGPHGRLSDHARALLQDGSIVEFEQPDGRVVRRRISALAAGAHLIVREDVTEDTQVRQALIDQQSRLSAVMDAAQGGIVGLDRAGRVTIVNSSARHLLGGISDATPFDWPEPISFLDSEGLRPLEATHDPVMRALAGQTLTNELALLSRRNAENPRYVRLTSSDIPDGLSADVSVVLMITDVTELERNRQQLERSGRLDALGQLTGGIAHDFNNLLATILYGIQLAEKTEDPNKRRIYLKTASDSVQRGTNLTERLLAFARRQPGHERSARVKDVLEELKQIAEAAVQERVALEVPPIDESLWLHCDVAQFENAILNLILNAHDAILEGGRGDLVKITVREITGATIDGDMPKRGVNGARHAVEFGGSGPVENTHAPFIEISVTDNGPGMSDEVKRRAIDPFFTTKDTGFGTGLGLSIVYGFVKQAGGHLRIYSIVGEGTTIRLILPRGAPSNEVPKPPEPAKMPRGNGETVLIVEDERGLLAMMRELVEGLNYTTRTAENGNAALEILRSSERIDLLMTDIVMPGGIGGFQLARAAREVRPGLPVIYMSGYTGFPPADMGDVHAPLIQKPSPPLDVAMVLHQVLFDAAD